MIAAVAGQRRETSSWSVPGINLAPGLNVITVTAMDTVGNSTQAVLSVFVSRAAILHATAAGAVSGHE